MASSSSLVLDEVRLLLSRTLFPIFLLAPMSTTVQEQSHLHLVRHVLQESWSWNRLKKARSNSSTVELVTSYLLSVLAYPFYRSDPEVDLAATLRVVLSLLSALSSIWLARRIRPAFGTRTAKYYLVFEATQLLATREMTRLDGLSLAVPLVRIASALLITPRLPSPLDADDRPRNASSNKTPSLDTVLGLSLLALASVVLCPALIALLVPSLWNAWSSGSVDGVQVLGIVGGLIGVEADHPSSSPPLLLSTLPTTRLSHLFSTSQNFDRSSLFLPYLTLLGPTLLFSTFAFLVDKRCRTLLGPAIIALLSLHHFPWLGGGGGGGGEEETMKRVRILVLVSSTACGVAAATSARLVGIM
ncbi:BZ3500_MvSof-1268-A1-R1_Chr4-1g06661 [Microbotryum saponariae]|uniref:BZ3500_MvSof-1268-A1-R1_Chr4-1g06661 protein n=1 Tax=Microbotryum saponariae TaxID=289078 RepID=A0A2X0KWD6_9BASI|nr:BZ3500_MvSof-1268-A1-R1_Chr4-1g06661 [Microbotryum saponariae]SDA06326.1 BZ3501_MvSof-1269-A2-R1_Chr4-1g06371 [Microbotryum saponariae]